MNKELLKEYLSDRYQGCESFLNTIIFPIFGEDNFEDGYETELLDILPERRRMAEATGICSVKQIGKIYVDVEPLYIFDITVSDRVMMERNRVSIQRLIRAVMDQYSCAFMLFHYDDDSRWDWRFTYCYKSANANESTDSKRYTFLLGPGQSCRTAADNFIKLYDNRKDLKIANIEKAFDVEALSKEFFGKYKEHYTIFVDYMIDPKNGMRQQFIDQNFDHTGLDEQAIKEREEKPIRDYVKRLLGRIVFLHFLQKKGWLGVDANGDWGSGDHDFMYQLFENATDEQKDNFLDDVLEPIFNALNKDRSKDNDCVDTKVDGFGVCRIPYLNGGLFERDKYDEIPTVFPYHFFENLLTFFHQYNFTIDENDPNEAEVGIDPEMLGSIFENLLEDNKDKGAFYTPKEIVQYMCRESLIAYLQTDCPEEKKDAIRQFVTTYEAEYIEDIKEDIDKKLRDVKICDPAIGSGAFPMGLLRELFFCRSAIEPNIVEKAAEIKKHIIQNSIYGVDIEKGAIDIARLRFWLSIVVDSDRPEQLPNFDYKFMQGNSLIESFMGVDLSEIMRNDVVGKSKKNSGVATLSFDESASINDIRELLQGYFSEKDFEKKKNTKKQINEKVKEFIGHKTSGNSTIPEQLKSIDVSSNDQFFLWHTWFADVFNRTSKQGFDIVIGNPPYIDYRKIPLETKRGLATYESYKITKTGSIYTYFIELSLNLLRENGLLSFINPYQYINADSGLGIRTCIFKKHNLNKLIDISNLRIFDNANTYTCINIFISKQKQNDINIFSPTNVNSLQENHKLVKKTNISETDGYKVYLSQNNIVDKLSSQGKSLSTYVDILCGLSASGFRNYVTNQKIDDNYLLFTESKQINSFVTTTENKYIHRAIYSNKPLEAFEKECIFMARMTSHMRAAISKPKEAAGKVNVLYNFRQIKSLYLLGLLNSKLLDYYYRIKNEAKHLNGGAFGFDTPSVKELPILINPKYEQEVILIVKKIIEIKQNNISADIIELQQELDNLVYKIYDITPEEIKIIEE